MYVLSDAHFVISHLFSNSFLALKKKYLGLEKALNFVSGMLYEP